MKYIIISVETESFKLLVPFVFPEIVVHSEMFKYSTRLLQRQFKTQNVGIYSAGFYDLPSCKCYGESISLNVKSNPQDNLIIEYAESTCCNTVGLETAFKL